MIGQIRDSLNQAPPWVTYSIVGVVLLAVVGLLVYNIGGSSGSGTADTDKNFYCESCGQGFTVSAEEARQLLREAAKASGGTGQILVKCKHCGKNSCVIGRKCEKCGAYFAVPERSGSILPTEFRDECPKCGYSPQRYQAVKAGLKQNAEGKWEPDKMPAFIRDAVEDAIKKGYTYDSYKPENAAIPPKK
jgi:hypothetical protein